MTWRTTGNTGTAAAAGFGAFLVWPGEANYALIVVGMVFAWAVADTDGGGIGWGVGLAAAWFYEPLPRDVTDSVGEGQVVDDESVDAVAGEISDGGHVVGRPGVHDSPVLEPRDQLLSEKSRMNHSAVNGAGKAQPQQQQYQFETVASRPQGLDVPQG